MKSSAEPKDIANVARYEAALAQPAAVAQDAPAGAVIETEDEINASPREEDETAAFTRW